MNHQRLQCYRRLLSVAQTVPALVAKWPTRYGYLVDQLQRALTSAIFNLAEGNGRASPKERRHFFSIALGSLAEVDAAFDVVQAFRLNPSSIIQPIQSELRFAEAQLRKLREVHWRES